MAERPMGVQRLLTPALAMPSSSTSAAYARADPHSCTQHTALTPVSSGMECCAHAIHPTPPSPTHAFARLFASHGCRLEGR